MAVTRQRDLDQMLADLERLEREERELSALRRKLHDRIDSFPNDLLRAREREVSDARRELHRRIDRLRAELGLSAAHAEPVS